MIEEEAIKGYYAGTVSFAELLDVMNKKSGSVALPSAIPRCRIRQLAETPDFYYLMMLWQEQQ